LPAGRITEFRVAGGDVSHTRPVQFTRQATTESNG
jgi:hypothetical protein